MARRASETAGTEPERYERETTGCRPVPHGQRSHSVIRISRGPGKNRAGVVAIARWTPALLLLSALKAGGVPWLRAGAAAAPGLVSIRHQPGSPFAGMPRGRRACKSRRSGLSTSRPLWEPSESPDGATEWTRCSNRSRKEHLAAGILPSAATGSFLRPGRRSKTARKKGSVAGAVEFLWDVAERGQAPRRARSQSPFSAVRLARVIHRGARRDRREVIEKRLAKPTRKDRRYTLSIRNALGFCHNLCLNNTLRSPRSLRCEWSALGRAEGFLRELGRHGLVTGRLHRVAGATLRE